MENQKGAEEGNSDIMSVKQVSNEMWQTLAQKKIIFGHQSVGLEIIEGMKLIMESLPNTHLNIVELSEMKGKGNGCFAHFQVGKNQDPESKITDFISKMNTEPAKKADVAFFKFCFVDVNKNTDIHKLFQDYKTRMALLKTKNPSIIFVHCTVPLLKKKKSSIKSWIKNLLGKQDHFFDFRHNIKRNQYNEMIIAAYQGKEPIFDIAKAESTYPDGRREFFIEKDRRYFSLIPEYTYDGGHLNEIGRRRVAEQLLLHLANL